MKLTLNFTSEMVVHLLGRDHTNIFFDYGLPTQPLGTTTYQNFVQVHHGKWKLISIYSTPLCKRYVNTKVTK